MPSEQLGQIVQLLRSARTEQIPTYEDTRLMLNQLAVQSEPVSRQYRAEHGIRCEPVDAGGVRGEWITPSSLAGDQVILYLHGGGYVAGSLDTHRELVSRMAHAARARALLVDYRLAPEHPFPAALQVAMAAYRWLISSGVAPGSVIVAGDSAGGGLTLATLVAIREAREPMPGMAVCLSPWTDLTGSGASLVAKAEIDPFVRADALPSTAALYHGDADPRNPLVSPLFADLAGLPPILIQVGTSEVLLDDSTRFAERARAAGVAVTLDVWEDMIHVWQAFASMVPEGQQAIEQIGKFIREHAG